MANRYECQNCSRVFNPNNYSICPSCKAQIPSEGAISIAQLKVPQEVNHNSNSNSEVANIELELLRAQNRTTHAVRSLAISFVAAPIIAIAIIIAVVVASATGNSALIVFTGILGAIIVIATLFVSLTELAKSKVS